jgi:ABC-type nitrate/sulfonate/bicarbonate transport system substrate-binding protein
LLPAIFMFGAIFITEQTRAAEPSNKVRIGYPSSAVSTLPFDIAKEKGFYAKAGLDVEYIQMRSASARRRSSNGNIHLHLAASAINAAVAGLPLVVVLSLPAIHQVLVTTKEIKNAGSNRRASPSPTSAFALPRFLERLRKLGLEENK